MALRVTVCPAGHNKQAVGVDTGTHCAECRRIRNREQGRRRRAAKGRYPISWCGETREPLTGLRQTREYLGLTKADLAALTGLDRKTLWNLEAGRYCPYPATKRKLLDVLGPLIREKRAAQRLSPSARAYRGEPV